MIIHDLEQNSPEWYAIRLGKPTASGASNLVTSTGKESKSIDEYAIKLAGDLFAGEELDSWTGNYWTERGHELEDSARSLYELINDNQTDRVGFITDDDELYGASPDSLVLDCGMLEIKCKKASEHIKTIMYINKMKKPPTEHYSQCQMQTFVTGRKWVDLMFYHPSLPEKIIRINADEDFHSLLSRQLKTLIQRRDEIVKMLKSV